ncbi:MAG: hypothetical protein RL756_1713 [Pseudomonadota bacterium]
MHRLRPLLPVLLVVLATAALAWWVRKGLVEPDAIGSLCSASGAPAWCEVRRLVIEGFVRNVYGYVSVLAALLALWRRVEALAWLALVSGLVGCVLYRFEPAGAGLLAAVLILGRLRSVVSEQAQR